MFTASSGTVYRYRHGVLSIVALLIWYIVDGVYQWRLLVPPLFSLLPHTTFPANAPMPALHWLHTLLRSYLPSCTGFPEKSDSGDTAALLGQGQGGVAILIGERHFGP